MKSCFLIGHREASWEILPALTAAIELHIMQHGVTEFFVGQYGNFDRIAARAVIAAKEHHPGISLVLLLPYHPAQRPVDLPPGFDSSYYPFGLEQVPYRFAIVQANRIMVQQADFLIAYAWHPASNARNLLEYAQKREKQGLIQITTLPPPSSFTNIV